MAEIWLSVGGNEYGGWKTARVTRSIESISGSFELGVSERWSEDAEGWPIEEEAECVVFIDDTPVITGYVDGRSRSYDAQSHTLTVSGRDKTGLLVDCSANPDLDRWEFKGVSVLTFAKRICEPYGIDVTLQSGLSDSMLPAPPKKLSIDPGDTAFTALENACRLAALLPVSDGLGGLVLTRAGTARCSTDLVEGENILAASADFDAKGRFARYHVIGQHKGTDNFNGVSASSVKGTASDANVKRTARTLIVRPECSVTTEHAKMRAQWEASTRAARAMTATATVQGWLQGNGVLWPVNTLVAVRSPRLGIDGDMLISEATYTVGEGGTTTTLALKRPDAFKPEPTIAGTSDGRWAEIARGV